METSRIESESALAAGDEPIESSFEMQEETFLPEATEASVNIVKDEGANTKTSSHNPPQEVGMPEAISEGELDNSLSERKPPVSPGSKELEVPTDVNIETGILWSEDATEKVHQVNCSSEIQSTEHPTRVEADNKIKPTEIEADAQIKPVDQKIETASSLEDQMDTAKNNDEEHPTTPPPSVEPPKLKTPEDQGCVTEAEQGSRRGVTSSATTRSRGRKRQISVENIAETPAKVPRSPGRSRIQHIAKEDLSYTSYVSSEVGDRVLSCGEGEQLGHPGRRTTKKPRKVDVVEDERLRIIQVVAGGVHSALLTVDGDVYMCGINENGTVPAIGVEPEGSTDEFTKVELSNEIKSQGKIVMLAAGASFTAALTEKGSVIAWGNLRDLGGEINVHSLLEKMKDHPVVLIHYKKRVIVKIAAGENHLVMLEKHGRVLTFGDGKMGQLGRSRRIDSIRPQYMVDEDGGSLILILKDRRRKDIFVKDIHAGGFWTILVTDDQVFSFGLNNFDHLGIPVKGEPPTDPSDKDERELRIFTPVVADAYLGRTWTHIDGMQHIIARDTNGDVYGIGKNTDNALGLGTWTGNDDSEHWKYSTLERVQFPPKTGKIAGTTAKLGCSIAWTEDGDAYAWGCDTSGQLGLGLKDDDDKIVPKPQQITSAHLEGYKIISASISDNHSLFLAVKKQT